MKIKLKTLSLILALFLVIACFGVTAFAVGDINLQADCTLKLSYVAEGVEFSLYRVADIDAEGKFTPAGAYASESYSFDYTLPDAESYRVLAETLAAYTARDKISPVQTAKTNENGDIVFDTVSTGLYLAIGERHFVDEARYTPKPTLVVAPGADIDGTLLYEFWFEPKYEVEENMPETVTRRAHKVWANTDDTVEKPAFVEVQLLRNGEVYDTVTLNADNGWSCQWDNLDNSYFWQLTEKDIPAYYTLTVEREGVTFAVVNNLHKDRLPPPPEPDLPQTGMLWWPIPLLACGGLVLFCIGLYLKRRQNTDEG